MAKQLVSPVERHLEKAILGVAGILLLGAIAKYLVTSPNQLEMGGEAVSPNAIDEKVAEKAAVVRLAIRNARPPESGVEPLYEVLIDVLDPFRHAGLSIEAPAAVPIGPEVPTVDKVVIRAGEKKLVEMMKLGKPIVRHGRSTFIRDSDGTGGDSFPPADWVTVSAVFNVEQQMQRQMHEYGPKRNEVIFGRVEMQRRARRDDGSWSEDDWALVDTWPAGAVPPKPEVRLAMEEGQWVLPRDVRSSLERFLNELRERKTQLDLIRPLPLDVQDGTAWGVPIITSRRDVLLQDYEYLYPNQPLEGEPDDRYPDAPTEVTGAIDVDRTPQQIIKGLLEESRQYLELAQQTRSLGDVTKAYNRAFSAKQHPAATRRDKTDADGLMRRANQLEDDIKRGIRPGRRHEPVRPGPVEKTQERLHSQQLWIHDAWPGSIKNGNTYQYRLRVWIYNCLAGEPNKFSDPHDAKTVFIEGPWSEPTDPVMIELDTYYFVTNSDAKKDIVSIEMCKWFEGVWVKDRFKFKVGDALNDSSRQKVPPLEGGEGFDMPLITFAADASIVDIDHQRRHRERKRAGRGGVKFEPLSPTCSVVFVDSEGRLHERFLPTDKGHPAKATVLARVWKPPRRKAGP